LPHAAERCAHLVQYNNHHLGQGAAVYKLACERGLEGIVSKRADGIYEPGQRSWLKTKCLNREEFVVVGYSDPEGSRYRLGSLLLGYYTLDGRLLYAGRAGTGMAVKELERVWQRLQPLSVDKMPLAVAPPREQVWLAGGVITGALGSPRDGRGGQLRRVHAGRFVASRRLPGRAGRQGGQPRDPRPAIKMEPDLATAFSHFLTKATSNPPE
jgi:ATP dependent DNA ligase C terminal region